MEERVWFRCGEVLAVLVIWCSAEGPEGPFSLSVYNPAYHSWLSARARTASLNSLFARTVRFEGHLQRLRSVIGISKDDHSRKLSM